MLLAAGRWTTFKVLILKTSVDGHRTKATDIDFLQLTIVHCVNQLESLSHLALIGNFPLEVRHLDQRLTDKLSDGSPKI